MEKNAATNQRAPNYWAEFTPAVRKAFNERCGWLAMWIASGTVDHFRAQKTEPASIYEWDNLRYASLEVNTAKKPAWDGLILDPFEVEDRWFEVILPSCQLVIREDLVPPELLPRVRFTVDKLELERNRSGGQASISRAHPGDQFPH
jgi:hypothetical protein